MSPPVDLSPAEESDLIWCESIIRLHSGSFYRAFKQLPPDRAAAVFAVYAFCRIADDSIDIDQDAQALEVLSTQLELFAAGLTPDEPLWRALRWAFESFSLEIEPFREMIEGQRRDTRFIQPQTREDLLDYCYLVAGTVGLMILPLLCETVTPKVRQTAIDLGVAMQLTNILRDVSDDYHHGRIYLPAADLALRHIPAGSLGDTMPSSNFSRYWQELAQETLLRYQAVLLNLGHFDPQARLPIALAIAYYSHITLLGMKNPETILKQRRVVPDWYKLILFYKAKRMIRQFNRQPGG